MAANIVYDYQVFSFQKYGGISRYFYEISSRIAQISDRDVRIIAPLYVNEYFNESPQSNKLMQGLKINKPEGISSKSTQNSIPKAINPRDIINQQISNILISIYNPDIIHETYFTTKNIGTKRHKRVVTVHDMIHEKFSSSKDPTGEFVRTKAIAINRADLIICVSENTRKDLIEILGVDKAKISTIYHGCTLNINIDRDLEQIPQIEKPYLLYVGERDGYKNFSSLLSVYKNSKKLKQDFQLVCFGSGRFSSEEIQTIQEFQLEGKVIHLSGSDDILAQLYRQAAAFIYPSLYEGFGIPPLEAMSCGCPVVCSNVSSIPEIVGDAGEYFDPYDLDSMSHAIEKVVYSEITANNLKRLGYERVKLFSWDLCAEQTNKIYQSLL
jgi:glycosyltransferase involved in cell wall biosynthesis